DQNGEIRRFKAWFSGKDRRNYCFLRWSNNHDLYKGINVISIHGQTANNQSFSTQNYLFIKTGSAILVASYLSLAALYILQVLIDIF
ncbi:hypothetical protein PanWU01x14_181500, partial [Parasponia andersonii]